MRAGFSIRQTNKRRDILREVELSLLVVVSQVAHVSESVLIQELRSFLRSKTASHPIGMLKGTVSSDGYFFKGLNGVFKVFQKLSTLYNF
jgi:hypothetical protein